MVAQVFANDGLKILDASQAVISINSAVQPVDHIVNVVTIQTSHGFPNDGASPPKAIPNLLHELSGGKDSSSPYHNSRVCLHPWSPKLKNLDNETKAGDTIYKRATRSLCSNSQSKLSITREVLLPLVVLLTGKAESCEWDIFDIPISTIGFIKQLLGHYGNITLPYIKAQSEIISAYIDKREQEDGKLYNCLMVSLTP